MFAEVNVKLKLLEPTILYLDENPPKIFKNKKASKKIYLPKKLTRKKDVSKPMKSKAKKLKGNNVTIKKESPSMAAELRDQIENYVLGEDPLYTPDKEIKMETDAEHGVIDFQISDGEVKQTDNEQDKDGVYEEEYEAKFEVEDELEDKDYDDNYYIDSEDDGSSDDDEPLLAHTRSKGKPRKYSLKDDDPDEEAQIEDDDDEPLLALTRSRGRPRVHPLKGKKKKRPRLEKCGHVCKQKCNQKFRPEQRQSICSLFWSLSEEEKVQYIRNHVRSRVTRFKRKRLTNCDHKNCYYLDDGNTECPNLLRVCRTYFENTLCLSKQTVKKALEGFELDIELEVKPLIDQRKEYEQKKSTEKSEKEVQQFLDPETGNLVTIDPKAKKATSEKSAAATTATKKSRIRRKPGDPTPEHNPKPIKCAERCIFKCHTKFTEEERKKICDVFWSMEYNRRKDFILARIETRDVMVETAPEFRKTNRAPRSYQTRFYLGSGINSEHNRVCKKFFMATLSVNRMFIANAINFADKNTGCYTGADMRGRHLAVNKISDDRKKIITDHIASYPTWIPKAKSKTRYLHHTLSIKRMYTEYKELCLAKEEKPTSSFIYYTSFHKDFAMYFLKNPEPPTSSKGCLNRNQNISHYIGDEPGGMWFDPQGGKLDLNVHHPAHSFMRCYYRSKPADDVNPEDLPPISSGDSTRNAAAAPPPCSVQSSSFSFSQQLSYAHLIDPILNSTYICPPQETRHDSNPNLYDINLQQPHRFK